MLTLSADISRLLRRSREISRRYPDVARRAANATAFYLRERTPDLLEQQLDRPTRRTAKASSFRVDQARGRDLGAVLRAIPAINSFLRKLQFGLDDEFTTRPIAAEAFDRFGNIVKRAHLRPSSKAALLAQTIQGPRGRVGKFFFGDLGRSGSPVGLWQRYDRNRRVKLFAIFERDRQNRQSLHLLEAWQDLGRDRLRRQLRYWTRRFLTDPDERLPRDLR